MNRSPLSRQSKKLKFSAIRFRSGGSFTLPSDIVHISPLASEQLFLYPFGHPGHALRHPCGFKQEYLYGATYSKQPGIHDQA